MAIYTIEDELTPMPATTQTDNTSSTTTTSPSASTSEIGGVPQGEGVNTDITPTLQSQLGALDAQRQADLDHINRNYQDLNQEYDDQLDIIDNLHKTISRRKVVDPRAVQARQALGSLYDTIQLIGSAASMAGKTTPPAPQLTSAQAQQNTIADRLYAAQRQADQDYTTQLQHITRQQQQARADIAKQRRQSKTEADRMRLNTNKHYDTLSTRLTEGERDRQERFNLAVFRENEKQKRQQEKLKQQGVKNAQDFASYDGQFYKIDKSYKSAFKLEAGKFAADYGINLHYEKQDTGLSGIDLLKSVIIGTLEGDLQFDDSIAAQAYQDALDIFETYFTPVKQPQQPAPQSTTKTYIPGFSASTSTTGKKTIPGF